MNLGSFSIAMPTPVLGESHHQAKGAPGLVTCSNPGHRAQAKAGPSGRPSPALHSPTFPLPARPRRQGTPLTPASPISIRSGARGAGGLRSAAN